MVPPVLSLFLLFSSITLFCVVFHLSSSVLEVGVVGEGGVFWGEGGLFYNNFFLVYIYILFFYFYYFAIAILIYTQL